MLHCRRPQSTHWYVIIFLFIYNTMSIKTICQYPDPVLRKETEIITVFDEKLAGLVEDMVETMYDAPGVGLAAPQIGQSLKLIVVDTSESKEGPRQHMALVNPLITKHEGKQVDEEGCLSVPELTANVIAESMYSPCDIKGNQYLLLDTFVDFRKSDKALMIPQQESVDHAGRVR